MSGLKISEACELAQESGDHRLALLIAQSAGSVPSRQLLIGQLYKWHEQQVRMNKVYFISRNNDILILY